MCGGMVDIQSATAEIMRGKKEKIEETTGQNIMSASAKQGDHNDTVLCYSTVTASSAKANVELS